MSQRLLSRPFQMVTQTFCSVCLSAFAFVSFSIIHFVFSIQHSFPVPYWDESGYIGVVTRSEPFTLKWLWSPANEHRIVLVRLIYFFLGRLSALNESFMNAFNVSILVATAGVLLGILRKLNRKIQYTDAIIPLLLLNLGHGENTIWPNQIGFVLSPCLVCINIALLALPGTIADKRYYLIGPFALVMCLCGANGLPVGLSFAPFLFWIAFSSWRTGAPRRAAALFLAGFSIVLYVILYFATMVHLPPSGRPFVFSEGIIEGVKVVSLCFGAVSAAFWPYSGVGAIIMILVTAWLLIQTFLKHRESRVSVVGLVLGLGGLVGLCLGIGMSRTYLGSGAGFASRYALESAPLLLATLLAFDRFGTPQFKVFVRMTLFSILCLLYWPNSKQTIGALEARVADGHALEQQVRIGMPISKLATDFGARWMFTPDIFARNMRSLAKARMAIYSRYEPPTAASDTIAELADGTELKGPATSGQLFPLSDYHLSGGIGLIAYPPHTASISRIAGLRSIQVGFGILPGNACQGVEFRILLRRSGEPLVPLWSRTLDMLPPPHYSEAQKADIALPEAAGTQEQLVFETVPVKDINGCGSYWTDVHLR